MWESKEDDSSEKKGKVKEEKKITLATFFQLSSVNKYVLVMLKKDRAMESHTLEGWQGVVKDLLNKKAR